MPEDQRVDRPAAHADDVVEAAMVFWCLRRRRAPRRFVAGH